MSGTARLVASQNAVRGGNQDKLRKDLVDSNKKALKIKKIPLKHKTK